MMLMNEAMIKEKSEELHIPFSHLLPSAVTEYVLWLLQQSEWKERLWLRNGSSLGADCYRRKPVFALSYYYKKKQPEEILTADVLEEFLTQLITQPAEGQPQMSVVSVHLRENDNFQAELRAVMGMIEVLVKLQLEVSSQEELQPAEGELCPLMQNDQVIRFLQYPSEQIVAENFVTILEKMELINDLTPYQELYAILGREAMDGRRLQQLIAEEGRKRGLIFGNNRLSTVLSYEKYTYMKKKWKAYLKREQRKTPQWEEVMQRLAAFSPPLWDAIVEDRIYIGDWMPELQRFL